MTENAIELVDNHHGIYIPLMFVQRWDAPEFFLNYREISQDILDVKMGPDNENYWEAWENILDNAKFCPDHEIIMDAQVYTLYHDMDLWAIPENEIDQIDE